MREYYTVDCIGNSDNGQDEIARTINTKKASGGQLISTYSIQLQVKTVIYGVFLWRSAR